MIKFNEAIYNSIIHGDCLEIMRKFPDGCIDLIVTSPPYNIKNSTGNGLKVKISRTHK